jgi:hypothetical protein
MSTNWAGLDKPITLEAAEAELLAERLSFERRAPSPEVAEALRRLEEERAAPIANPAEMIARLKARQPAPSTASRQKTQEETDHDDHNPPRETRVSTRT